MYHLVGTWYSDGYRQVGHGNKDHIQESQQVPFGPPVSQPSSNSWGLLHLFPHTTHINCATPTIAGQGIAASSFVCVSASGMILTFAQWETSNIRHYNKYFFLIFSKNTQKQKMHHAVF